MSNPHTPKQRNSLHLWCQQCADVLNDAGLDQRAVLTQFVVSAPNTKTSFKEGCWKPLQEILEGFESTEENSTTSYDRTFNTLVRHFGEKHGITLPPWPDRFTQAEERSRMTRAPQENDQ